MPGKDAGKKRLGTGASEMRCAKVIFLAHFAGKFSNELRREETGDEHQASQTFRHVFEVRTAVISAKVYCKVMIPGAQHADARIPETRPKKNKPKR